MFHLKQYITDQVLIINLLDRVINSRTPARNSPLNQKERASLPNVVPSTTSAQRKRAHLHYATKGACSLAKCRILHHVPSKGANFHDYIRTGRRLQIHLLEENSLSSLL